MNRRAIVSVICIVVMCSGAVSQVLIHIHPWWKALLIAFATPWIATFSYIFGRLDERCNQLEKEIQEIDKEMAILKMKMKFKLN